MSKKKNYSLDYEKYPDGISSNLNNYEESVWDRGYYLETEEGIWYEMYVNDQTKENYPEISSDFENEDSFSYNLKEFYSINVNDYNEYNQITFFVPKNESTYNLEELTNIFL